MVTVHDSQCFFASLTVAGCGFSEGDAEEAAYPRDPDSECSFVCELIPDVSEMGGDVGVGSG